MTLLEAAKAALPIMKEALEIGFNEGMTYHPDACKEYQALKKAVEEATT